MLFSAISSGKGPYFTLFSQFVQKKNTVGRHTITIEGNNKSFHIDFHFSPFCKNPSGRPEGFLFSV
jgi:hypothetical protein